jgi:hypothetical protein
MDRRGAAVRNLSTAAAVALLPTTVRCAASSREAEAELNRHLLAAAN